MIDFAPMRRTWSLGFVLVTLIPGCGGGGGSNQQSARDVAQAYVNARNQGDAAKVCELYSEQLIQSLKTSNCVAFVRRPRGPPRSASTATRPPPQSRRAVANAIAPIELELTRENGQWKISRLGGPEHAFAMRSRL